MELIKFESLDRLNHVTADNSNVLLIISRSNCPQCDNLVRALKSNAELQAALAGVKVGIAKLEDIPTIATTFGVRAAPSMIMFKDDDEVTRLSGFMSAGPLLNALRNAYMDVAVAA